MNTEARRCTDCKHFRLDLGWSGFEMAHHLGSVDCDRGHGCFDDNEVREGSGYPKRDEQGATLLRQFARKAATCVDFEPAES